MIQEDEKHKDWKNSVFIEKHDRAVIDKQVQKLGEQHYGAEAFNKHRMHRLNHQVTKALINQDIWSLHRSVKEQRIID